MAKSPSNQDVSLTEEDLRDENKLEEPEKIHVRVFLPSVDAKFHILEQCHCGQCWRPIWTSKKWPGPRTSNLPPNDPEDRSVLVSPCGHVYHSSCTKGLDHCSVCHYFVKDSKFRGLNWKPLLRPHHERENDGRRSPSNPSASKQDSESAMITELSKQIDILTKDIKSLRKLSK